MPLTDTADFDMMCQYKVKYKPSEFGAYFPMGVISMVTVNNKTISLGTISIRHQSEYIGMEHWYYNLMPEYSILSHIKDRSSQQDMGDNLQEYVRNVAWIKKNCD